MNIKLLLVLPLLFFITSGARSANEADDNIADPVHAFSQHFEKSFQRHWRPAVSINGITTTVFDYAGMTAELNDTESDFSKALAALNRVDVTQLQGNDHEKAFWINAYNIGAMKLVADHYPIDSIRSLKVSLIKYPWNKRVLAIGEKKYTLREIEKSILLERFPDPRVVFAVSCAAVSCPDRQQKIFHGDKLDEELDEMVRIFLANTGKGANIDRNKRQITVSWIFKADNKLFDGEGHPSLIKFLLRYLPAKDAEWLDTHRETISINYLDHDWALNDLSRATQK